MKESSFALIVAVVIVGIVFVSHKIARPPLPQQTHDVGYPDPEIRELDRLVFEYQKADLPHQRVLREPLLEKLASFPKDKLPADLAAFYDYLERGEL